MKFEKRNINKKPTGFMSVEELSETFNLSPELIQILIDRNIDNEIEIEKYLGADDKGFYDPFLITDMKRAVDRINLAKERGEQITIWGDYDVDGTSASSILYLALKGQGFKSPKIYLPHRHTEGYGLNEEGMMKIVNEGSTSLLITVDCGITSKEVVEKFISHGIDVIITDHHEVPEEIPYCTAVIDTKRKNERYPFKEMCGAGIAFKLVQALFGLDYAKQFLDIASLATVADVMPLVDENRLIVKQGLNIMNNNPRIGLKALIDATCGEDTELNAYHYGFRLGPAINACGRISHSKYAFQLIVSDDMVKATKIANWIKNLNDERKHIEEQIKTESLIQANKNPEDKIIITHGENWNEGVIGIAASKVMEEFYKPTIVFAYNEEKKEYKGSARSIHGISIYDALKFADKYILKWGGHEAAAGLTVQAHNFYKFKQELKKYMEMVDPNLFERIEKYDSDLPIGLIDESFINSLSIFEPCGVGNPSVSLLAKDVDLLNVRWVGESQKHYASDIKDPKSGVIQNAIAFNAVAPSKRTGLDILYKPGINTYKDKNKVQLNIKHIISNDLVISDDIQFLKNPANYSLESIGVSANKFSQFESFGITDTNSLIDYLPKKYMDYRNLTNVDQWESNKEYSIIAKVKNKGSFKSGKGFYLICVDNNSNTFMASFFNQNYAYSMFIIDNNYFFCGKVSKKEGNLPSMSPTLFSPDTNKYRRLFPVYKKITKMSNDYLEEKLNAALNMIDNCDYLTEDILRDYDLISKRSAVLFAHQPKNEAEIELSKKRYLFDALFKYSFNLNQNKNDKEELSSVKINTTTLMETVKNSLPYKLTNDQSKAIDSVIEVVKSGKRLNSLIQGDVGCGKTIVSLLLSVAAQENGYQSCVIAPTEVLATQHYGDFSKTLEPFGLKTALLTSSTKSRERKKILEELKNGAIHIILGTHSLLQDTVEFSNLGLLVIDEQHRFGVAQREKIKGDYHFITMSATPIPRTLAIATLGSHIKVININEKPAGRKPIITSLMKNDSEVNKFMLSEIKKGHQCYIVCPLIDDSEAESMSGVESVNKVYEKVVNWFSKYPTVKISMITGKMKKKEIEEEIQKFKNNETQILISTTIVEVGVNVPNSTVMVLKNSERFGLAQAHQLRGRVGRGDAQGYMILQTKVENEKKAEVLINHSDGFEVSKADAEIRGTGDLLGTKQSGQNTEALLMINNFDLFEKIEKTVQNIFKDKYLYSKFKENLKT